MKALASELGAVAEKKMHKTAEGRPWRRGRQGKGRGDQGWPPGCCSVYDSGSIARYATSSQVPELCNECSLPSFLLVLSALFLVLFVLFFSARLFFLQFVSLLGVFLALKFSFCGMRFLSIMHSLTHYVPEPNQWPWVDGAEHSFHSRCHHLSLAELSQCRCVS